MTEPRRVFRRLRRERRSRRLSTGLRAELQRRLRALDGSWVIVRDREVGGVPVPVTVAAGPTGIWVLWVPDPLNTGYHPRPIAEAIASPLGVARERIYLRPLYSETAVEHVVSAMVSSTPWFSSHHAVQWAQRLGTTISGGGR
jgi:hypothetical protein